MFKFKEKLCETAADDVTPASGGDSLLAGGDVEPVPTNNTDWYLSEGVKGEGEQPEYFNSSKYKTLSDQAKAYPELAKKLGAYTGSPEEYKLEVPEDLADSISIDTDSEPTKEFLSYAKENGITQEFMDKMMNYHTGALNEALGDLIPNREDEMALLGSEAAGRIKNVSDWGMANLSQDQFDAMRNVATSAQGVELIEALIGKTKNAAMPTNSTPPPGMTPSALKEMRFAVNDKGQRKTETDPDYKKEVDKAYKAYYGDGPAQTEVI